MRIIDVFLYSGEQEMANLRQLALAGIVDAHVAIAADHTHQGQPHEVGPCRATAGTPVANFLARVGPNPGGGRGGVHTADYQRQERRQRDAMASAAGIFLEPDDVFLLSDVDEIPSPEGVGALVRSLDDDHEWAVLGQRMHGFALDYLHPQLWWGTMAARRDHLHPQAMRDARGNEALVDHLGWYGSELGWHLSWMGDVEEKARKRDTFSHRELHELDVEACWREARHANGEELRVLTVDELKVLTWPEPMLDGSFIPPASWWSPSWTG